MTPIPAFLLELEARSRRCCMLTHLAPVGES